MRDIAVYVNVIGLLQTLKWRLIILLIYSVEQSPWEGNRFSASQEISRAPATFSFLEPDQSGSYLPFPLPEDLSLFYPPIYATPNYRYWKNVGTFQLMFL
jgi:hypothetical protein